MDGITCHHSDIFQKFPKLSGFNKMMVWIVEALRYPCLERQMSSVQNPGWLFDIGDYTTQLYMDSNNHYKDPY